MSSDLSSNVPMQGTLDDLMSAGGTTEKTINVQISNNMGNRTFLLSMPMKEFYDVSIVANETNVITGEPIAQRKLDRQHAFNLSKYLLKGLISTAVTERIVNKLPPLKEFNDLMEILGKQPYVAIQPVVCNLRNIGSNGSKLRAERLIERESGVTIGFKIYLPQEILFHVVDGQHRRYAIQLLLEFLKSAIQTHKLPKKNDNLLFPLAGDIESGIIIALQEIYQIACSLSTIQIESHLGLNVDEERQLFHDLNNLGKKVDASLVLQFDSANPVNSYIKDTLIDDDSYIEWNIVEKDNIEWSDDTGAIARKELTSINARLFLNATNINGATATKVADMKKSANKFWEKIGSLPYLGEPLSKDKTILAQPVVLKAIAKLVYDYSVGKQKNEEYLNTLFEYLDTVDFSHTNPLWRYFLMDENEKISNKLLSLSEYYPDDILEKEKTKTFCTYDSENKIIRFGNRHNDVFPLIVEMIRYSLGLPAKKKKSK